MFASRTLADPRASSALPRRCDKRFSRSDELTRHVRIHQTDRGRKKANQQAAASGTNSPNGKEGVRPKKESTSRQGTPSEEVRRVLSLALSANGQADRSGQRFQGDGSPEPQHRQQPGPYGPPMMGYVRPFSLHLLE